MAEEIGFENGRNSNFEGLVTLSLTLDPAIRHTVVHYSSTSTYIPNFIQIEETFCGRTDVRTDGRTFSPYIIKSTFGSRPNNCVKCLRNLLHSKIVAKIAEGLFSGTHNARTSIIMYFILQYVQCTCKFYATKCLTSHMLQF